MRVIILLSFRFFYFGDGGENDEFGGFVGTIHIHPPSHEVGRGWAQNRPHIYHIASDSSKSFGPLEARGLWMAGPTLLTSMTE